MPVFKHHLSIAARGVKTFLNLEAGITRGAIATLEQQTDQARNLEDAHQLLASKDRELAELRAQLIRSDTKPGVGGINPKNIVWVFCVGRSGSTWLSSMMDDVQRHNLWSEPNVGVLFGYLYYVWAHEGQRRAKNFILGHYKESWLRSIRNFVLDEGCTRFPMLSKEEYLVIKEPNGSIGAPLLMEALPESRMIFLVRDPRDVVASALDSYRVGGWQYRHTNGAEPLAEEDPNAFIAGRADRYLLNMSNAKEAYDAHRGHKVLVKYEDLRADTLGTMERIYSTLGIPVDDGELARVVKKHSWENIPEDKKGEGKFHRKAKPGGWREDLTPEQAKAVERITAPLLKEFYPYEDQDGNPLRSQR